LRLNHTAARSYIAALALSLSLGGLPVSAGAAERAAASSSTANAAALANIRIDNFGQVTSTYFRGAQPKGQDFAALAAAGMKTVIDLAEEGDRGEEANVKQAGMQFVRIPMTTHESPGPETIAEFLSLVNDPANQPVYVHCIGGRHRTGVMTAIYRMTAEAWTPIQAFKEMKQYKFGADFLHQEFKDFVLGFTTAPAVRPQ
jgi:protein tyrosine/serine phosphatase